MKRLTVILFLISPLLGGVGGGVLFSQDYARLSERSILGTARYVGMCGAMTAIGGDPSAALDNPAGLGLYRRPEVLLTADFARDNTGKVNRRGTLPQASVVFALGKDMYEQTQGLLTHNLMFSYQRHQTYMRDIVVTGAQGPSLSSALGQAGVDLGMSYPSNHRLYDTNKISFYDSGTVNEFGFDWAFNYSNKFYYGLGLRLHSISLIEDALYTEDFNADTTYLMNKTHVYHTGVGFSAATGFIYRPVVWLRLGFSIQTPSVGKITTYSSGDVTAAMDSVRVSENPSLSGSDNRFHLPLRTSTSVAFQIGAYGMIALQYDYSHISGERDNHSLRAGVEVVPVLGLYLNAGYACESAFSRRVTPAPMDPEFLRTDTYSQYPRIAHYASFAIGYRGENVLFQVAYQYRWQKLDFYAHEYDLPHTITADTHRLVFTLGWHRYY